MSTLQLTPASPISSLRFLSLSFCRGIRTTAALFLLPDSCLLYISVSLPTLSLAVRLHDSISEEGFHYLVFDLWVYSAHTHTHTHTHKQTHAVTFYPCVWPQFICVCWQHLSLAPVSLSVFLSSSLSSLFDSSLLSPSQGDRRRAVWRHCSQGVLQWGRCQVSASHGATLNVWKHTHTHCCKCTA